MTEAETRRDFGLWFRSPEIIIGLGLGLDFAGLENIIL